MMSPSTWPRSSLTAGLAGRFSRCRHLSSAFALVAALRTQRAAAVMEYAAAAASAGLHERALPYLYALTAQEPLNEKAHALLMIALAGSGQQAADPGTPRCRERHRAAAVQHNCP